MQAQDHVNFTEISREGEKRPGERKVLDTREMERSLPSFVVRQALAMELSLNLATERSCRKKYGVPAIKKRICMAGRDGARSGAREMSNRSSWSMKLDLFQVTGD